MAVKNQYLTKEELKRIQQEGFGTRYTISDIYNMFPKSTPETEKQRAMGFGYAPPSSYNQPSKDKVVMGGRVIGYPQTSQTNIIPTYPQTVNPQNNLPFYTSPPQKTGGFSSVYAPALGFMGATNYGTATPTGTTTKTSTGTATGTGITTNATKKATEEVAQIQPTQTEQKLPANLENERKYLRNLYLTGNEGMKNWALQTAQSYGLDITMPSAQEAYDEFIESTLKSQKEALSATQQKALAELKAQKEGLSPQYQALRTQASNQAMQQARNLAEYMAARGQATSGVRAQQELQMGADLQGQFGRIGLEEQRALQDIDRQVANVNTQYQADLASATSEAQAQKAKFKAEQAIADLERKSREEIAKIQAQADEAKLERQFQMDKDLIKARRDADIAVNAAKEAYRASGEVQKINYKDDARYKDLIGQIMSGNIRDPKRAADIGTEREFSYKTPKDVYLFISNRADDIIEEFGIDGWNALLKAAENRLKMESSFTPSAEEF